MNYLSFKEWLSMTSPEGAGDIWTTNSNADPNFGSTGLKSKYFQKASEKAKRTFNPKALFGKKDKEGIAV
jgi:hypothetical protein